MAGQHTVKAFDQELNGLVALITRMGGLAEANLASAIEAVVRRDSDLAAKTLEADPRIDGLEREVDEMVVRILALRQPVASDLRLLVSALRIATDIERIGDYAANVAKRAIALNQAAPVKAVRALPRIGSVVLEMIKDVLDAYVTRDAAKARTVWNRDEEVDDMYTSLFRELLTYMMEDPRSITVCTHLLFIAKNLERIGDHATNIAELVHYTVEGRSIDEDRPKSDQTAFAVTP